LKNKYLKKVGSMFSSKFGNKQLSSSSIPEPKGTSDINHRTEMTLLENWEKPGSTVYKKA